MYTKKKVCCGSKMFANTWTTKNCCCVSHFLATAANVFAI